MKTKSLLLSFALLLASGASFAFQSPIAGKWDCTSTEASGNTLHWTLTVRDEASKLSGSILLNGESIELLEPVLKRNVFTFQVRVHTGEIVEAALIIHGNRLTGKYQAGDAVLGTIKGARRA